MVQKDLTTKKDINGKPIDIPKGTFWVEEKKMLYMVRCPKCKMENYTPNVASGICTWCGYDANKDFIEGKE
jgi:ribosomal protein L37E